jgi:FkbM family methyltransferase
MFDEYLKNKNISFENFDNVKLDIGLSYSAPHSQLWLKNDEKTLVFGFEPNPDNVKCILNKNIQKINPNHSNPIENKYIDKNFFVIPIALDNVDIPSERDFFCMKDDPGTSSFYQPKQSLGKIKDIIKVPVYPLKSFFDVFPWYKIDKIDYIKIDAQGSDLDILKSAGDYLKERVVYVTAEPENELFYFNCIHNTEDNINEYMKSQNFIKINHPNTKDPTFVNKKYLDIADKIFIKQLS